MQKILENSRTFVKANVFNVVVLGFLILHTLFSGKVPSWNIFSLFPPIVFLIILLVIVAVNILMRNKYGLIFVLLSLPFILLNSDINFNALSAPSAANEASAVKIFNWNTQFWEKDNKEEFIDFIKSKNADIYQLQEYINIDSTEVDDQPLIRKAFPNFYISTQGELITISRFPIVHTYTYQGYFLKTDININNKIVTFYNVHFPVQIKAELAGNWFNLFTDLTQRFYTRQEAFKTFAEDVKTVDTDYYISGDFNTTKSMGAIDQLLQFGDDSYSHSNYLFPATWSINKLKFWRIDYNVASKNIKIVKHEDIDPFDYSDHWGQMVTLEL